MNILIRRYKKRTETIDGEIFIGNHKVCDCAENAQHALAAGIYPIVIIKCHQHARKQPCVVTSGSPHCQHCARKGYVSKNTNMPHFCPQICPGNGVYNRTDGAIIVGEHLTFGSLIHPIGAFETLYRRIRKASKTECRISLVIEEDYDHPTLTQTVCFTSQPFNHEGCNNHPQYD